MSRQHRFAAPIVLAIALFISACGGSSSSTSTTVGSAASEATESEAAAESMPSAETDTTESTSSDDSDRGYESPVAELFGIPVSDEDALTDQTTQLQAEAERRTATCMREQGFEYKPVDYSQFDDLGSALAFEGEEFAKEYGFGIATSIDGNFEELAESFVDPNQEYLSSLSEGEQEAYYNALMGGSLTIESFDEAQEFEPAGCQGDAYEEAFSSFASFDEFGDELDAMEQQMESDPRVVEANATWAACMFDRGYGYTDAEDARSDIQRRYDDLVRNDTGGGFPDALAEEAGDDEGGVIIVGGPIFSPETQAKVDDLAVEEREVAVASWTCEQPIEDVLDEVRIEYELRFVEQYGDAVRSATGS